MNKFIGTKEVKATPLTLGEYNALRGWDIPLDEDPNKEGYLVEYLDSPNKNHPDYDNYISWSPKDVFERSYKLADTFYDRLVLERDDLKEKVDRLSVFLSKEKPETVTDFQWKLLKDQLEYMKMYLDILKIRVKDLENIKTWK